MEQKVLLDSNVWIKAIEDPTSQEREKLKDLLKNENTTIFITPLIRFEILRGVEKDNHQDLQKYISTIEQIASSIDIDKEIADLATKLFRFEQHERKEKGQTPKKIDKHNFDLMHFATAKTYELQWYSNDGDMVSWEKLWQAWEDSQKESD